MHARRPVPVNAIMSRNQEKIGLRFTKWPRKLPSGKLNVRNSPFEFQRTFFLLSRSFGGRSKRGAGTEDKREAAKRGTTIPRKWTKIKEKKNKTWYRVQVQQWHQEEEEEEKFGKKSAAIFRACRVTVNLSSVRVKQIKNRCLRPRHPHPRPAVRTCMRVFVTTAEES